jgi:hypothetical protein
MAVTLPGNACRTITGWPLALVVHFARTMIRATIRAGPG